MGDAPDDADVAALESQFPLTELDRKILSQTDEEFEAHDWQDLKKTIGASTTAPLFEMFQCTAHDIVSCKSWVFPGLTKTWQTRIIWTCSSEHPQISVATYFGRGTP